MSLQTLIRVLLLALALTFLSPLLLMVTGAWSLLIGPGLLLVTLAYLALLAGRGPTTRWQVRYYLPEISTSEASTLKQEGTDSHRCGLRSTASEAVSCGHAHRFGSSTLQGSGIGASLLREAASRGTPQAALERLNAVFQFLDGRDAQPVVEANAQGLFLELSPAFDEYIRIQLEKTLPEAKVVKVNNNNNRLEGNCYLGLDLPTRDVLRWATETTGREVRLHFHRGGFVTSTAESTETRPPGRWIRVPMPRFAAGLWRNLPVWDELSVDTHAGELLPFTGADTVYSSRSRLLELAPPADYRPVEAASHRYLGRAVDGRSLTLDRSVPLLTVGAPHSFLVGQTVQDLEYQTTVVVSPHRSILNQIRIQADHSTILWLDQENGRTSEHLTIAAANEWDRLNVPLLIRLTQTFLDDLGLNVKMSATRTITQHLVYVLAASARATGHNFTFTDLYAVSQSIQALRAFLTDLQELFPESEQEIHNRVRKLLDLMGDDKGYRQIVAVLNSIRSALKPLRTGSLHILSQPPFLDTGAVLDGGVLILVPMLNAEFPEHDRLLSAMLDLVLSRLLVTAGEDFRLALHLHDPHLYRRDAGRRWLGVARRDGRLSLLLDVQEPDAYHAHVPGPENSQVAELVFRCSESLASTLVGDWELPCAIADLVELPGHTALARTPDLLVALEMDGVR